MSSPDPLAQADTLAPGTRLAEFEIERVLGVGGFGVVYLALDHALGRRVAIKEYMPAALAVRRDGTAVSVCSQAHAGTFAMALRSFVNEARLLAQFDHPALVKVHRFWEDNGTAYMAMPYYEGQTLRAAQASMTGAPDEAWLRGVTEPLLGALEMLHGEQVFHRDIAPDNILLLPGGSPVLLDFGAARRVIGDGTQSLTAILKPSFAPIEQYGESTQMRQGAWTDLYALAAVLYFCITGRPPGPATSRVLMDEIPKLSGERTTLHAHDGSSYSEALLATIDAGLAVEPHRRPQTAVAFRASLRGEAVAPAGLAHIAAPTMAYSPTQPFAGQSPAWSGSETSARSADPLMPSLGLETSSNAPMKPAAQPVGANSATTNLRDWAWSLQYLVVGLLVLSLGAALASLDLFETTWLVRRRLSAGDLVRAAAEGGALAIGWLAAQRLSRQLRASVDVGVEWHALVSSGAIVILLSCAYGVLLPVLRPFMSSTFLALYKWAFAAAVMAAAAWLAVLVFRHAEALSALLGRLASRVGARSPLGR